jgi:hypothetical protein
MSTFIFRECHRMAIFGSIFIYISHVIRLYSYFSYVIASDYIIPLSYFLGCFFLNLSIFFLGQFLFIYSCKQWSCSNHLRKIPSSNGSLSLNYSRYEDYEPDGDNSERRRWIMLIERFLSIKPLGTIGNLLSV